MGLGAVHAPGCRFFLTLLPSKMTKTRGPRRPVKEPSHREDHAWQARREGRKDGRGPGGGRARKDEDLLGTGLLEPLGRLESRSG